MEFEPETDTNHEPTMDKSSVDKEESVVSLISEIKKPVLNEIQELEKKNLKEDIGENEQSLPVDDNINSIKKNNESDLVESQKIEDSNDNKEEEISNNQYKIRHSNISDNNNNESYEIVEKQKEVDDQIIETINSFEIDEIVNMMLKGIGPEIQVNKTQYAIYVLPIFEGMIDNDYGNISFDENIQSKQLIEMTMVNNDKDQSLNEEPQRSFNACIPDKKIVMNEDDPVQDSEVQTSCIDPEMENEITLISDKVEDLQSEEEYYIESQNVEVAEIEVKNSRKLQEQEEIKIEDEIITPSKKLNESKIDGEIMIESEKGEEIKVESEINIEPQKEEEELKSSRENSIKSQKDKEFEDIEAFSDDVEDHNEHRSRKKSLRIELKTENSIDLENLSGDELGTQNEFQIDSPTKQEKDVEIITGEMQILTQEPKRHVVEQQSQSIPPLMNKEIENNHPVQVQKKVVKKEDQLLEDRLLSKEDIPTNSKKDVLNSSLLNKKTIHETELIIEDLKIEDTSKIDELKKIPEQEIINNSLNGNNSKSIEEEMKINNKIEEENKDSINNTTVLEIKQSKLGQSQLKKLENNESDISGIEMDLDDLDGLENIDDNLSSSNQSLKPTRNEFLLVEESEDDLYNDDPLQDNISVSQIIIDKVNDQLVDDLFDDLVEESQVLDSNIIMSDSESINNVISLKKSEVESNNEFEDYFNADGDLSEEPVSEIKEENNTGKLKNIDKEKALKDSFKAVEKHQPIKKKNSTNSKKKQDKAITKDVNSNFKKQRTLNQSLVENLTNFFNKGRSVKPILPPRRVHNIRSQKIQDSEKLLKDLRNHNIHEIFDEIDISSTSLELSSNGKCLICGGFLEVLGPSRNKNNPWQYSSENQVRESSVLDTFLLDNGILLFVDSISHNLIKVTTTGTENLCTKLELGSPIDEQSFQYYEEMLLKRKIFQNKQDQRKFLYFKGMYQISVLDMRTFKVEDIQNFYYCNEKYSLGKLAITDQNHKKFAGIGIAVFSDFSQTYHFYDTEKVKFCMKKLEDVVPNFPEVTALQLSTLEKVIFIAGGNDADSDIFPQLAAVSFNSEAKLLSRKEFEVDNFGTIYSMIIAERGDILFLGGLSKVLLVAWKKDHFEMSQCINVYEYENEIKDLDFQESMLFMILPGSGMLMGLEFPDFIENWNSENQRYILAKKQDQIPFYGMKRVQFKNLGKLLKSNFKIGSMIYVYRKIQSCFLSKVWGKLVYI